MAQRKKGKKAASSITSVLVILIALVYYYLGGGYEDTEIVQNEYTHKTEVETSETSVSSDLEIYFFDVGQADSALICNNGEYMLIDAGNNQDGDLIVSKLNEMGIHKLDYLIGTHPHEDHIGGLDDVILGLDIENIYMPKRQASSKTFEDVLDAISSKNMKVTSPEVGTTFYLGEAICEVISADSDASDTNDSSIVIELTFGDDKYLFTGDIGEEIETTVDWNDIDVLKVAHHGSRYSSCEEFLNQAKPEIAVISDGKDNDYGHPHEEALERLESIGAEIYRTDKSGTIYLKSDGKEIEIESLDICVDGN